ncbi:MAG: peptidoglycan DD-metalloendopeptidase family protein [Candidatus Paceibacterota bacterium]|jgi:murein DD-endopeptidase MepM/ murein hydrolase activator NlpD
MRKYFFQLGILLSLGVIVFMTGGLTSAQTVDELQQKITAQNTAIQKLEDEIKQYQGDLTTLATKKKTLSNAVAALATTQKALEAQIKVTQAKVDTSNLTIRQLSSEISYKEDEISGRIAALKEALRVINEGDKLSLVQVALSDKSFSDFWNDIESLGEFSLSINENVELIKSLKADLENKNKKQQTVKGKLLTLQSDLSDQKKITLDNKKQTTKLLTQTKNQETQYQKILKDKLALKDALEKELREYESTLKFILDPTSIPPRGTKVFAAPLNPLTITQQFGKTSSSGRLYASGTHNGTDFRASVGTPVKAMLSGTVIGTGDTDLTCAGASYGKWVLIKHNNGLASLYAHFSLIKVSKGQTVNTSDLIGYSGNTGYSTGPHLHLTVFAAAAVEVKNLPSKSCGGRTYTMPVAATNAYLDPMDYM